MWQKLVTILLGLVVLVCLGMLVLHVRDLRLRMSTMAPTPQEELSQQERIRNVWRTNP
jgi:hypothetical protein